MPTGYIRQSPGEHYAENAQHDIKTGKGSKKDIAYDIKKASQYGYMSHKQPHCIHKHMKK
tara:strand:+ start:581 stop:760 length:180 start_codon:yes stop_codon:yes gene_type:complete